MKTLTFNKKSWHFLLATNLGFYIEPYVRWEGDTPDKNEWAGSSPDICTYSRAVLMGFLILLCIGALIATVGYGFFHMLFGIIFSLIYGQFIFTEVGLTVLIITCFFSVAAVAVFGMYLLSTWRANRKISTVKKSPKPDNFIKHAYKSWKNKYCVKINFKDPKHDDNLRAGQ